MPNKAEKHDMALVVLHCSLKILVGWLTRCFNWAC